LAASVLKHTSVVKGVQTPGTSHVVYVCGLPFSPPLVTFLTLYRGM